MRGSAIHIFAKIILEVVTNTIVLFNSLDTQMSILKDKEWHRLLHCRTIGIVTVTNGQAMKQL